MAKFTYRLQNMGRGWYAIRVDVCSLKEQAIMLDLLRNGDILTYCDDLEDAAGVLSVDVEDIKIVDPE